MVTTVLRAATLFSILLASGCARTEHHCSAPADRRNEIEAAASMWNAVTTEPIFIDGGDDCRFVFVDTIPRSGPYVRGLHEGSTDKIYLHSSLKPGAETVMVAAHELGHYLGLGHHPDLGIMNINGLKAGEPFELSPADIDACRKEGPCP